MKKRKDLYLVLVIFMAFFAVPAAAVVGYYFYLNDAKQRAKQAADSACYEAKMCELIHYCDRFNTALIDDVTNVWDDAVKHKRDVKKNLNAFYTNAKIEKKVIEMRLLDKTMKQMIDDLNSGIWSSRHVDNYNKIYRINHSLCELTLSPPKLPYNEYKQQTHDLLEQLRTEEAKIKS